MTFAPSGVSPCTNKPVSVRCAESIDRLSVVRDDVAREVVQNEDVVRLEAEPAVDVGAELDLADADALARPSREPGNRSPRCRARDDVARACGVGIRS